VHSKDDVLAMHGTCIVELSELAAFKRSENEALKALLTRCVDTVRKPYGRVAEELPRRVVFVGTTNDDGFLTDTTNRRYWPVVCHARKAALRFDHKQALQLLAAAHAAYLQGETWYLDTPELAAAQQAATVLVRSVSVLEEQLAPLLEGKTEVTPEEVRLLANPDPRASVQHTLAARAKALRGLGFVPCETNNGRAWRRK
jgi:predicted P-loop ATPase